MAASFPTSQAIVVGGGLGGGGPKLFEFFFFFFFFQLQLQYYITYNLSVLYD